MSSDPRYPLDCEWCPKPADHVAVVDFTGRPANERRMLLLCGPCAHGVTVVPDNWERWWVLRLIPDDRTYERDCDTLAAAAERDFSGI